MAVLYSFRDAQAIVLQELSLLKERIVQNMYAEGAVASGRTIASMVVQPTDTGGELVKANNPMPFGVLETGRQAGAVPRGFAQIIYDWMQVKGVHGDPIPYTSNRPHKYTPQERGDRSMAAAIAHVIHKGSKDHPKGGTALFQKGGRNTIYSNEIPLAIEKIEERITGLLSASIDEVITLHNQGGQQ